VVTTPAVTGSATVRIVDRCEGCGFGYDLGAAEASVPAIRAGADEMAGILRRDDADLRRRPDAGTWSPLEYACHVRDVLLVQRERALAARREVSPHCPPMGRDERVGHDGYADQAPADVARQLADAALLFTNVLGRLDAEGWERTLRYNYPEPADRSLRWLAAHTLHEVRHHLGDMRGQIS
jgi:hypothetical protein